ncbi:MAG: 16S rRNA (adenine(1518)-N(6)/adenine(1519)-N(6))-dimethyltransferase RsmA [Acidobacteria bacterium]|nr:16S rRNA (adenine(1518)-N(6)/adenine(1519)-N(6))-dimethyltransferase RsmA [Acidobacteriota bacterium]
MIRARRRFAQHFLEPVWVDKVVRAVDPRPTDRLLEIGPGRGALTRQLALRVERLLAVEIDRDLAARLLAADLPNVTVKVADILDVDLAAASSEWLRVPLTGSTPIRVVGNLPYNISSPILFRLLDLAATTGGVSDAVLMLQKEVADRLVAPPGTSEYGVLTILTALGADVTRVLGLPPGAFRPAPRVHSAVVRLVFRPPPVEVSDVALLTRMVRRMFMLRRKTLLNALTPFGVEIGVPSARALTLAALDPRRRPETLQLIEIARLADVFAASNKRPML